MECSFHSSDSLTFNNQIRSENTHCGNANTGFRRPVRGTKACEYNG